MRSSRTTSPIALAVLLACGSKPTASASPEDRARVAAAAAECTDAVDALAPSYQMVGPKLASALKLDRGEAQRLMRDSIELLISTRELLCGMSQATVQGVIDTGPYDAAVVAAKARVDAALAHLGRVRTAYDALLGAASSADAPVDEAALLERFSNALLAQ